MEKNVSLVIYPDIGIIQIIDAKSVHLTNIMMLLLKNARNVRTDINTAIPHSNVKKSKYPYAPIAIHTMMVKSVSAASYLSIGMKKKRNVRLA